MLKIPEILSHTSFLMFPRNDLDGFYHRLMDSHTPNQLVDFFILTSDSGLLLEPELPLF